MWKSWSFSAGTRVSVLLYFMTAQAIRAHLRKAAHPFDLPILQMDSRRGTETNRLWFQKSFRMERLSKLIGGENGLISAGSAVSAFFFPLRVCFKKALGFSGDSLTWIFSLEKSKEKKSNLNACNMWTVVIAPPPGTMAVSARPRSVPLINSRSDRKPEPAHQSN